MILGMVYTNGITATDGERKLCLLAKFVCLQSLFAYKNSVLPAPLPTVAPFQSGSAIVEKLAKVDNSRFE